MDNTQKEKQMDNTKKGKPTVDSLIELKILIVMLLVGLFAFSIYTIAEYISSDDKNEARLAYIIIIGVLILVIIAIVGYDFKEHKKMIKGSMNLLRNLKSKEPWAYGIGIFDLILFYIILAIFFYYSVSGGKNILGFNYKRHAPPGTSHGEDLKDPEDY